MTERAKTQRQWLLGAFLCLPAVAVFVWGFVRLFMDFVVEGVFVMRFWLLPLLTIGLVVLLFRSKLLFW